MARAWSAGSRLVRYLAAVLLALATLGLTIGLQGLLGGFFFAVPLAAIALIALALGVGAGIVATGIVALGVLLGLVVPGAGFIVVAGGALGRLVSFLVAALLISTVAGRLREATERLSGERRASAEAAARTVAILESISDGFVSLDRQWRFTYANPAAERMLADWTPLVGRSHWDIFPKGTGTDLEDRFRRAAAQRRPEIFESYYAPWDRWYETSVYPAQDGGLSVFFRDVTETRKAREELRVANERTRRFIDSNVIGVVIGDTEGRILDANDYYLSLLGFTREELNAGAIHWDEMTPPEYLERDAKAIEQARTSGTSAPYEKEYVRKDRSRVWVLVGLAALPGGGTDQQAGFVLDISDRKRIEQALREREAMLATAQRVANLGSWEIDVANGRVSWSEQMYAIHGVDPERFEPSLQALIAAVHPDDRERFEKRLERLELPEPFEREQSDELELRIVRPNGTERVVLARAEALRPGRRYVGTLFDVTERRQAEKELRDSEERFRRAIIGAPFPIMLHADDGRIVAINEALTRATGYTLEDIPTTRDWTRVAYPDRHEAVREVIDRLYALERPILVGEHVVRTKDGAERVWEFGAAPLGKVGGRRLAMTMALDVTARKEAEARLRESEDRLRVLAENSQDMIFRYRLSPHRGFEYLSPASAALTGYAPEEHYANPALLFEIVHPDDRPAFEQLLSGEVPPLLTSRLVRSDGRVVWVEQRLTAVRGAGGEVVAIDGVSRDITERKRAEEALHEADRRKDEFIGMLSHELRNPLAPIRNSLYLLRRTVPHDERAERAIGIIDRQIGHLTRLIEDLLDVTRISRGKILLQRGRLDLADLVRRTADDYRSVFEANGLELRLELPAAPVWVDGDATRLAQVLGNLLQNSAKFTARGGRVEVALGLDDRGQAVLEVVDTGIGIEPAILARLFEPFSQARQPLDRSRGGLGLGLALVKGLVDLHGGEVRAFSEGAGRGARFVIKLPLEQGALPEARRPSEGEHGAQRRVLVIEDNPDTADTIRDILELAGHRVEVAYTGPEGLARARELRPDVVLCDIGLPGMDGYALAHALRADPALAGMRLVAVTGYARPGDRRRAVEAGFDRHITKPPNIEELERVVAEARPLASRGLQSAAEPSRPE